MHRSFWVPTIFYIVYEQHETSKIYEEIKHLLLYTHIYTNALETGIPSQTLYSYEYSWSFGQETSKSLHVILDIYVTF